MHTWNMYTFLLWVKSSCNRNDNINSNKDDRIVIWINLPYLGKKGEQLTKSLVIKLKRSFKENVKFKAIGKTNSPQAGA